MDRPTDSSGASRILTVGLLTGLSLTLSVAENALPLPLPGVKPGLANAVTLLALLLYGPKTAWPVLILRLLLAGLFSGNFFAFGCSVAGGVTAMAVMTGLLRLFGDEISTPAVSAAGAVTHNGAQLLFVVALLKSPALLAYLPVLVGFGLVSGLSVGLLAGWTAGRLLRIRGDGRTSCNDGTPAERPQRGR
ncbi:MAG: Gx transporter family protein [Synergistaceae bacterium]|jgi:heptaprenyl diphosphate synthase|nr:Gx transporter family protein [Synergistaceae bacterium]